MTGTAARPQTTRESLGGSWATSFWVWLVLLVPALVLSGYQDSSVPYPTPFLAALAAIAECAAALVPFLVVSRLRRRRPVMPLAVCVLYWSSVGIVHGLASGLLVSVVAGAYPNYLARTLFWVAACLIWLPLTTYASAQISARRVLLTSLALSVRMDASARAESLQEMTALRSQIVVAVRYNIRPVVIDIVENLEAIGSALDAVNLAALGRQLAGVSDETSRIIATTHSSDAGPDRPQLIEPLAPVAAALDFEQKRPILAALLTAAVLLPMIVALSFGFPTVRGQGLGTTLIVLLVTIFVIGAGLSVPRLSRHRTRLARISASLAIYGVAGISTALAAYFGPWQPVNEQNQVLALLLLIAVPFAAIAISASVGLGNANLAMGRQIGALEHEILLSDTRRDEQRREVRKQIAVVTHGPLRGNLAACAMALNFHAAEIATSSPARTEYIVTSVQQHLAEALVALDGLR